MLKNEKPKIVEELTKLIDNYSVIGVINMEKFPSRALQNMRESMRDTAVIRMSRKSLIKRAIKNSSKKDIHKLDEKLTKVPALLMTNENPFKIFKSIKENKTPRAAKPGDVPANDITISKGPTPLPPGPSISVLQKAGVKASVQGGKIAILTDKVVCKAGDAVTQEVADVLSLLKVEPMEVGMDLSYVWEDGTIYEKDVLDVSVDDYINKIVHAVQHGVNLSVNTGYPTKLTAPIMIQKAFAEARTLAIDADVIEKDFIDEVLKKAARAAKMLEGKTGQTDAQSASY